MNRRPLHILFLVDGVFEDLPGGGRLVARELAVRLRRRGHDVTFLAPRLRDGAPADERGPAGRIVRYEGAGQGPALVRAGRTAAARLSKEAAYDIVHTHFAYAALGPFQSLPHGVPRVRTFHGPWDEEAWIEQGGESLRGLPRLAASVLRRVRCAIERRDLRRSDRVITLSETFRTQVTGRYGVPAARTAVIPGGVDLAQFRPSPDKRAVRDALGLPPDRRILLSVRRLAARMGLDVLIEAMPAVVARHPDALLLIGGKGPERERLERLIAERGLQRHVRLLGFISDDDLVSYYQAADVFVLPTLALEGFGLVTVESLACGVPVIGTPVGATPDILRPLEPRLVSAAATPAALSDALLAFFGEGWAEELSPDRLRQYVADRFTWDRHTDAVEALYDDLLDPARPGPTPEPVATGAASLGPE